MAQLENIEAIEKRLWSSADTLRSNSNYASNEYFMPVMGLIFLRHAYSRYLAVKDEVVKNLPKRGGKTRPLSKEDFSQKSAVFLQEKAQFDYLIALKDGDDRAQAVIDAMESIEADYQSLKGVLPKSEYQELDNDVIGKLLRDLNPEELKQASGDIFGRIYEYFLTQFADQKAHDGGEFFTPVSLVSMIANVLEPKRGIVLDPACGSGGMFVQSARFVEQLHENPMERLTFYGLEKNPTTIRLAKMNLAVHGLEGRIEKAITYYEDPHELAGKADFVMANPPFNVDEVDADKVKKDTRLPFGLPGVNKKDKVSSGNYIWISYFYSYLNETGRAGFVMSSQASSAGRDEAKIRQKLVETGHVEIMTAIRSNFFYTRTVPCELWFFNKNKPEHLKNKVLMIDARNIFRKVTRKIFDFSPEQLKNILSVVWLYRGENERFLNLVYDYVRQCIDESLNCFKDDFVPGFQKAFKDLNETVKPFIDTVKKDNAGNEALVNFLGCSPDFKEFKVYAAQVQKSFNKLSGNVNISRLKDFIENVLADLSARTKDISKEIDLVYKTACRMIEVCEQDMEAKENKLWNTREIIKARKKLDETRKAAVEQLKKVRYFYRQAAWLVKRFPDGVFCDVEGFVKLVDRKELQANDWSLTPGRYVGIAPEEEDEDFDFGETMREIHQEIESLNTQAVELAEKIRGNFEGMLKYDAN
ncbi:Type I restriction enzyme EcoKI M protein [Desulfonema limicola]|uniref:site-specific DNA-methyltransferase (adenine-specific) n=1 Tax=Desulfonema limicola TaxID=45656 RepID=A0A975B625_9BACT|nr:type I restriction-modification system subunit M [Desulfonema limicola]QTA79461.1 Type I restriction enzyme EcoKI M protein [Desulfonema limicola]